MMYINYTGPKNDPSIWNIDHESWLSQDDKLQETLGALGKLQQQGLIREVGLLNEHPLGGNALPFPS